jgi:hypothetical protein
MGYPAVKVPDRSVDCDHSGFGLSPGLSDQRHDLPDHDHRLDHHDLTN